jgi:hypothetical protein
LATGGFGLLMALALLVSVWGGGQLQQGDGWARWGKFGAGFGLVMGVSMVVLGAMLMHRVHRVLDDEGLSWWHTILLGWRGAFRMFGAASSGEFWGFVAFSAWVWILVVPFGSPWTAVVGVLLMVPLLSLASRRLLASTAAEIGSSLLTLLGLVVYYLI